MRVLVATCLFFCACGGQVAGPDGGTFDDAGQSDGGPCIDVDASAFDTSCSVDSDCIAVYIGRLCAGYNCICPTMAISASSRAAYQATISTVSQGSGPMCGCPAFGSPRCIASACVFCPNPALNPGSYPPGCPDGGP